MKRGFLNTSKAQKRSKVAAAEPKKESISGGKDPSDVWSNSTASGTYHVDPGMLDLHKLPPQIRDQLDQLDDARTRIVFRVWPRDPKGQVLLPSTRRGKETSNGLDLWGATLYDFYHVCRLPDCPSYVTTSTGSKLARAMRELGELDAAADEIAWADKEEDPHQVFPCDIGEVISDQDYRVQMGFYDDQSMRREEGQPPLQNTVKTLGSDNESIFDPSRYPYPWPLVPFSVPTPSLQKRIPFHLLPQKLIVHDPWNLLSVDNAHEDSDTKWTDRKDVIRTYSLDLSDDAKKAVEKEKEFRAKWEAERKDTSYPLVPKVEQSGPVPYRNSVLSIPPAPPAEPEETSEAHLYLSPSQISGKGNHSIVYRAEWELPRSLLVADKLCTACFMETVTEALETAQDSRSPSPDEKQSTAVKVETELPDSAGSTAAFSMAKPDSASFRSNDNPVSMELAHERELFPIDDPVSRVEGVEEVEALPSSSGDSDQNRKQNNGKGKETDKRSYNPPLQNRAVLRTTSHDGRELDIDISGMWQNPSRGSVCKHLERHVEHNGVPPTAKVQVAAKLSIQGDDHLRREARSYQAFPAHFFQHWNGYNLVPPLHDPVPVSAVVPQFYGYYIPDPPEGEDLLEGEDSSEGEDQQDGTRRSYLSPILLLEHCGIPIEVEKLNRDRRQECAALLYRLHYGGWTHGSFAPRNILVQNGPLTERPLYRKENMSFRLIDFGRSHKSEGRSRAAEEKEADKLLHVVNYI